MARKLPLETGATTPVGVKVRRIQEKLNREKQSNAQQFQPTLRSFMEIRGGLKGSQGWRGSQETSSANPKAGKRERPQPGNNNMDPETFGEQEERRTTVQGSPEHQLLKEAGALKPGKCRTRACEGAKGETTRKPERKDAKRKDSKEAGQEGNLPREGFGKK